MIEWKRKDKYLLLEMNESPANALTFKFLHILYKYLKKAEKEEVAVVILSSSFINTFSSGLDLGAISSHSAFKTRLSIICAVWYVHRLACYIVKSDKIYIACATGAVIGSAVTLTAACDLRIGSERTWLWIPDPQYGGLLADGGIELIVHACGITAAKKMCFTNERILAKDAQQSGMLHEVKKSENALEYCEQYANKLSKYSYETLGQTKHILNENVKPKFHGFRLLRIVFSKEMMKRLRSVIPKGDI